MPEIIAPIRESIAPSPADSDELFPIRDVSRLTGINPVTLRAWERRYGLIQPTRTESGHRLYSKADIQTVHRIVDWIERGVAVSKVGKILARDDQQAAAVRVEHDTVELGEWPQWQARLVLAVGNARHAIGALEQWRDTMPAADRPRLLGLISEALLAVVGQAPFSTASAQASTTLRF